jgi:D-amino-acid oxidase
MAMQTKVAVVGAGVSGLTCGVILAETGYEVEILAEATGPRITSGAAAAVWFPYDAEPLEKVIQWALTSFDILRKLGAHAESGVSMIEIRQFARHDEIEIPPWAISLGAILLPTESLPQDFRSGYRIEVPLIDTSRYLDYLAGRFREANGRLRTPVHLERLDEVPEEFPFVINCAGIGARTLVPDPELEPHRGQVVLVPKMDLPWALVCDDSPLMYVIPRANDCIFGGTNEPSANWEADPAQSARIVAECSQILGIEPPPILGERVGLRPYRRSGVCLETERLRDGRRVIHNYGHGGSGFTLSWGCAKAVRALAENC